MRYWLTTVAIPGFERPVRVITVNSTAEMASATAYWLFVGHFDYIEDLTVEIISVEEVPDLINKVFQ